MSRDRNDYNLLGRDYRLMFLVVGNIELKLFTMEKGSIVITNLRNETVTVLENKV